MTKEGVFSLGFFVGTPTAKVYVPMAQEEEVSRGWALQLGPSFCTSPSSTTSSMFGHLDYVKLANRSTSCGR